MAAREYYGGKAMLTKTCNGRFSSGECSAEVAAREVIGSRGVKTVAVRTKLYTDEKSLVLRIGNNLAEELEAGDNVKFKGYTYIVQAVRQVNCAGGVAASEYEVTLK